jgi:hypothetical protein
VKGRFKDVAWNLENEKGAIESWERVQIAVLMDLRDELKALNALLSCYHFMQIPHTLKRIDKRLSQTRKLPRGRRAKP